MYDAVDETGTATIGRSELRPAQPALTSKVAGQISTLLTKADAAHDAGDRVLEKSYRLKARQAVEAANVGVDNSTQTTPTK